MIGKKVPNNYFKVSGLLGKVGVKILKKFGIFYG
jgi:hypothetical protein